MIKHQMRITVRQPGEKPISIAEFKKVSLIKGWHLNGLAV